MTMISMRLLLAWLFALLLSPLAASRSGAVSISHGLQNLGNTCYLNSQLQCAYHIPLVRSIVEEGMSSFPNAAAADKKIEVEDTQEGEEEKAGAEARTSGDVPEKASQNHPPSIASASGKMSGLRRPRHPLHKRESQTDAGDRRHSGVRGSGGHGT